MTWLPVVEREIRVAARRAATYRIRFWAALIMLGFFAWIMMGEANNNTNSNLAGRELFMPLSMLGFLFAISIGVIATSDSVSEEKREGTLGLLFLTDLKGYDVILGKLVAHSISAFYALVAIMPILGMPLLMGGVTLLQFVKLIVALITSIVLSLAAGIFVSTHSRNERKALVFTFLLLLAVTCVPWLVTFWLAEEVKWISQQQIWRGLVFSPGLAVMMAMEGPPPSVVPIISFWYSVAFSWIGAISLLWNAAKTAPNSWTENAAKPAGQKVVKMTSYSARIRTLRRKLLEDNPFLWLAMRREASQGRVWLFVLLILAMWLLVCMKFGSYSRDGDVVIPTAMILHTGLKIWIVGEACRRFVEDRRNNAMEFLLSTPLNERQIIRGQWRALFRQFLWPMVAVLVWEAIMAHAMVHGRDSDSRDKLANLVCAMVFLPMDLVALGWASMWLGMTCKGRGRAILTGLALVMVVPWVAIQLIMTLIDRPGFPEPEIFRVFLFSCFSMVLDIVVIAWARERLLTNFRRLAVAGGSK